MATVNYLKQLWKYTLGATNPPGAASATGDISQLIKYIAVNIPGTAVATPPVICSHGREGIGVHLAAEAAAAPASAAWWTANDAILIPFEVQDGVTVTKLAVMNGATVSGNIDVGIYDATFAKVVSMGSTAQAGVNSTQEFNIADTLLAAGRYYFAIAMDNTTGTLRATAPASVVLAALYGLARMATAFPLPATITPTAVGGGSGSMKVPVVAASVSPRTVLA